MKNITPRVIVIHAIFWPIATISLFMNIWLFSSFFSTTLYRVFGGIIGASIDVFKLYTLNRFDIGLTIFKLDHKRKPDKRFGHPFPFRYMTYYILFLFVSAGASLLFGLIDIDKSIEKQNTMDGGMKSSLVRSISRLKNDHKDLSDFGNLNIMADRVTAMTNRLLLSTGLLRIEAEKNLRRKKIEKIEIYLNIKEKQLSTLKIESRGTFEVFDYLAVIMQVDLKTAKILFLFLIIASIEVLTEECRAAMGGVSRAIERARAVEIRKKGEVVRPSGPDTSIKRYRTKAFLNGKKN